MTRLEDILLPPNDYDLEKLCLSMLSNDISKMEFIDEDCFFSDNTKKVFQAIKKTNSTDFTALSIASWIPADDVIDLITDLVSRSSHDYIISQLNKYKNARILIRWIQQLENQARALEIEKARQTLNKIDTLMQDIEQEKSVEQLAMDYFEDIGKESKKIESWYKLLDDCITMCWWDLIVVAGRPSMWKTTVMQNMAIRQANNRSVWFISMEMTIPQLLDRFVCIIGWLTSYDMKDKTTKKAQIMEHLSPLMEKKLFITQNIYTLSKIEQYIAKNNLDVCYIDYLWLIQYGDAKTRIIDRISEITRQLKLIAKKRNCCIVLWSQLSREVEKRNDKRPILADLRDSWTIEQDADVAIMLYREEYYDEGTENKHKIDLLVRKNRNGELKTITLDSKFSSYRILDKWIIVKPF